VIIRLFFSPTFNFKFKVKKLKKFLRLFLSQKL
jgi:hypothetical protein